MATDITPNDVPCHYVTKAGEQIEITHTDYNGYCVDCWTDEDNNRWSKSFTNFEDALIEYNRWRYLS